MYVEQNFFEKLVRISEIHCADFYFPSFVMTGCGIGDWCDELKALTPCHGDCHTDTEIPCGVFKFKTRVYTTYMEVLRTLNEPKRNTVG